MLKFAAVKSLVNPIIPEALAPLAVIEALLTQFDTLPFDTLLLYHLPIIPATASFPLTEPLTVMLETVTPL